MVLKILYEDNHLLAVAKPPGLPTQGAAAGRQSLITLAKEYLKRKYRKPGNVYLGVVSRLDSPTSGVVVLARTSKAAARLSQQFRQRKVEKIYWAIVEGIMEPASAECVDWVTKGQRPQRMMVVSKTHRGALEARLSYRRLKEFRGTSLVEIALSTGRKHQIRVQLADRGHPIVGDRKYGSERGFARNRATLPACGDRTPDQTHADRIHCAPAAGLERIERLTASNH